MKVTLDNFKVVLEKADSYDKIANFINQHKVSNEIHCSFCGKHQEHVSKLVAGPKVYICNECVEICKEIMTEELPVFVTDGAGI